MQEHPIAEKRAAGTRARPRTLFAKANSLLLSVAAAICVIALMEMYTSHRVAVESERIQQFYVPNVLRAMSMRDSIVNMQTNLLEYSLGDKEAKAAYYHNYEQHLAQRQDISGDTAFIEPLSRVDNLVAQIHQTVESDVFTAYDPDAEDAALRGILTLQKNVGVPLQQLLDTHKFELMNKHFNAPATGGADQETQNLKVRLYVELSDTVSRLLADLDRFALKDDTASNSFVQNANSFSFIRKQLDAFTPLPTEATAGERIATLFSELRQGGETAFLTYNVSHHHEAVAIIETLEKTLLAEASQTLKHFSMGLRGEALEKISGVRKMIYVANLMMLACIALALILLIYTTLFIRRRLIAPVGSITNIISKLRKGERNMVIASSRRDDEMGDVLKALHQFQAELYELDALRDRQVAQYKQLEKRERQLRSKSADLEDANRDLEQFVYIASHDLREPLKQISGFADLLELQIEAYLDGESRDSLTRIQDYAVRMCNLIDDLRSLTKINKNAINIALCDMNQVVQSELKRQSAALSEGNVEVEVGILPTISCDADLMEEVFRQLIHNALQHGKHPLQIKIDSLLIDGGKDNAVASIRFSNSGEPADVTPERLILPFVRGVNRHGSGTGMGLAIVKKIVDAHAGKLKISTSGGWFTACIKMDTEIKLTGDGSPSLLPLKKSA